MNKPMFDITKPAAPLLDTDRLVRLLENNTDPSDRKFIIEGWIASQNKTPYSITTPLVTDTNANSIAMETFPAITPEEFQYLVKIGNELLSGEITAEQLQDILPRLAPILAKLKQYDGTPSLQTCFDAKGFPSDVLEIVPELAGYEAVLHLTGHIRVNKKQPIPETEQ